MVGLQGFALFYSATLLYSRDRKVTPYNLTFLKPPGVNLTIGYPVNSLGQFYFHKRKGALGAPVLTYDAAHLTTLMASSLRRMPPTRLRR